MMVPKAFRSDPQPRTFSEWAVWWRAKTSSDEGLTLSERLEARGKGLQQGETWIKGILTRLTGSSLGGTSKAEFEMRQELRAIMRAIVYDYDELEEDLVEAAMRNAGPILLEDREVVLEAVKQRGTSLEHACSELRADREVVLSAVRADGAALAFAAKEHRTDKALVLEAVRTNGLALIEASEELRGDREVVLEAIKEDGAALEHATPELQADKNFVLEAVAVEHGMALAYTNADLRSDKEVVLRAIQTQPAALQHADDALRADREVVLEAVKVLGWSLEYAAESLRGDRSVVLEAVKRNGSALQYASLDLRGDQEVVLEAVKNDPDAAFHAARYLFADTDFLLILMGLGCWMAWDFSDESLRWDKGFMLAAVKLDGFALQYASDELRADRDLVLVAVRQRGGALRYASAALRAEKDIILLAARHAHAAYDHEFVGHSKVKAGLNDEEAFLKTTANAIAVQGENEPVLLVSMTCHEDRGEEEEKEEEEEEEEGERVTSFSCEVTLLSGNIFRTSLEGRHGHCPTVNDLAVKLLEEYSRHTEVKTAQRVFITFAPNESQNVSSNEVPSNEADRERDFVVVSPWDWEKPLRDFVVPIVKGCQGSPTRSAN